MVEQAGGDAGGRPPGPGFSLRISTGGVLLQGLGLSPVEGRRKVGVGRDSFGGVASPGGCPWNPLAPCWDRVLSGLRCATAGVAEGGLRALRWAGKSPAPPGSLH